MNKKIKIIELLNEIANGEEPPKRIKYKYKIWLYDNVEERYCLEDSSFVSLAFETDRLTDEVEILEDNTKEIEELTYYCIGNAKSTDQTKMIDKINELVRAVNSIRKNIDKEYCCCCGVEITDENRALHNMCNECKYGIDWEEKNERSR